MISSIGTQISQFDFPVAGSGFDVFTGTDRSCRCAARPAFCCVLSARRCTGGLLGPPESDGVLRYGPRHCSGQYSCGSLVSFVWPPLSGGQPSRVVAHWPPDPGDWPGPGGRGPVYPSGDCSFGCNTLSTTQSNTVLEPGRTKDSCKVSLKTGYFQKDHRIPLDECQKGQKWAARCPRSGQKLKADDMRTDQPDTRLLEKTRIRERKRILPSLEKRKGYSVLLFNFSGIRMR